MVRTGMETEAARLATFDLAHQPVAKGRASSAKTRAVSWAYERPSPIDLAHAGFYFNPTAISPDNTACFLCERALDGWEEDDDPITEHLRHSPDCGWAMMVAITRASSNPAEIEDPTSERIVEARRATFFSWPHDGKRGWVCKAEKMIDAGWYFCPNEESEDFVTCAYCKLSLDGWEPKDDPFDEHYRRSPECSFFHFALSKKRSTKTKRGKATRSSKASRTSAQSNNTTLSESQLDLDSEIDQTGLSESAMGTSKAKKASKTKAKGRKAKKEEVIEDSRMDVDDKDEHEPPATKKTRGKKRTSDQISGIEEQKSHLEESEPVPKKRTTRTRSSTMKAAIPDYSDLTDPEDQSSGTRKRSKAGTKKRSTSKSRKPATSKSKLKSRIPDDAELEAQLEAELDRPESDHMEIDGENPQPNASGNAVPSMSEGKQTKGVETEDDELQIEQNKPQTRKRASVSTSRTRGSSAKPTFMNDSMLIISSDADFEMDNSVFPASHPMKRAQQQPNKPMGTTKAQPTTNGSNIRGNVHAKQASVDENYMNETATHMSELDGYESQEEAHEAPSTIRGMPKNIPQEPASDHNDAQETDFQIHTDITSPLAQAQECTPSPSPRSSDFENQPPSTMLSTSRDALSPSQPQPRTVTLAAATPTASPSKRQGQADQLPTTDPWHPVDLDEVFLEDPEDKENVNLSGILNAVKGELTAAEKQMTVEEWILWNAKNGEQKLRNECERVVGMFEREGSRAMRALEGIECCD